ncbi:MAG: hypothetical protein ACRCRZ_00025 [Metamycoplasmataceae bacterium]
MAKKELTNNKITLVGFLCCLILGIGVGLIPYLLIKLLNLKSNLWYILFIFTPPVIGGIIYWRSKARVVKN